MNPLAPSSTASAAGTPGVRRRWLFLVMGLALLFVLMPFVFWQGTWFGRPLADSQIETYLKDREHPRKAQHALSQIADRMLSPSQAMRQSARRFYPGLLALASDPHDELRITAAWVMGGDNTAPEFRQALTRLLRDPNPMVQRNAALALVRFGDAAGHDVIVEMLKPYAMSANSDGTLQTRLKLGDVINPGTLVAHILIGAQKIELRSQVPGTLDRWLVTNGARVSPGQPILTIQPSPEEVWEALRALSLIGRSEDLPVVEFYLSGLAEYSPNIRQQAQLTAAAIRSRAQQ